MSAHCAGLHIVQTWFRAVYVCRRGFELCMSAHCADVVSSCVGMFVQCMSVKCADVVSNFLALIVFADCLGLRADVRSRSRSDVRSRSPSPAYSPLSPPGKDDVPLRPVSPAALPRSPDLMSVGSFSSSSTQASDSAIPSTISALSFPVAARSLPMPVSEAPAFVLSAVHAPVAVRAPLVPLSQTENAMSSVSELPAMPAEAAAAKAAPAAAPPAAVPSLAAPSVAASPVAASVPTAAPVASRVSASAESPDSPMQNFLNKYFNARGCVLPVAGDGHCLFHIANTVRLLVQDKNTVTMNEGTVVCNIAAAQWMRKKAAAIFHKFAEELGADLESKCLMWWGEDAKLVAATYSGGGHGAGADLSLIVAEHKVAVAVIDSSRLNSVYDQPALHFVAGEPTYIVCVVKYGNHWNLGAVVWVNKGKREWCVLFTPEEWLAARVLIAKSLQANVPAWGPPPSNGTLFFFQIISY